MAFANQNCTLAICDQNGAIVNQVDTDDFPELRAARTEWNAGRLNSGLKAFQSALQTRPANVRIHVEFARALGQRHEILHAEQLLHRALELVGDNAPATIVVAQAFRTIFRQERALTLFTKLAEQNQLPPPILGELAVLHEQFGDYAQAREAIETCIAAAPDRNEPKLIQARILRHQNQYADAERVLQPIASLSNVSPMLQVGVWSELCYLCDAQARYDEAVTAIEHAKEILRGLPRTQQLIQQGEQLNRSFARLYEEIDVDTLHRWKQRAPQLDADVGGVAHLLGFPRSGTTLLERAVDAHAAVLSAPERVIFSKLIFPTICMENGRPTISRHGLDAALDTTLHDQANRYLRLHQEVHGESWKGRVHLDKNPNHMSLLAGLLRLIPNSKFIVALRDPRDVILSCYLRTFPLSEYSSAFLNWESTERLFAHEMAIWQRMRQLMADNWIEVRYEDTVRDLQHETTRVLAFLGLAADNDSTNYVDSGEQRIINSPTHADVRKPVYTNRIGRWQHYVKYWPSLEK